MVRVVINAGQFKCFLSIGRDEGQAPEIKGVNRLGIEAEPDAVLVNTAIAIADDPSRMGLAFKAAVEAGRAAYEIGLGRQLGTASATSPLTGFLENEPVYQADG